MMRAGMAGKSIPSRIKCKGKKPRSPRGRDAVEKLSRRTFLAAGAAVGAPSAGAATVANPEGRPKTDLIRVGAIALGDNSHLNYDIWAPMINPDAPNAWPVGRTTRMLITHCWDSRPELAEAFARKFRCTAVKK